MAFSERGKADAAALESYVSDFSHVIDLWGRVEIRPVLVHKIVPKRKKEKKKAVAE
ncbi:hypothetical protein [Sphingomonas sp.]|uniref:hypothetical protein n=1 Tax=Sphingomonas sp. TaxID=28214 RepID=UPI0025D992C5|nr:hypothetical protein [Sphingomonas sp.]